MAEDGDALPPPATNGKAANKRLSVERIYQKKSQLEHILLRPDTYIGSVQPVTEKMWIVDTATEAIVSKEISYVPGLYKIFDEILVNAADNKVRDSKMDTIKIDINPESNEIKIFNNGKGIPVVMHKDEKMFVPTMIFGHLLTSSNFNDEEEKVTGGRNGYGAKLCNVFSTKFTVATACKESKKEFKQSWAANMSKAAEPRVKEFSGSDYTQITFNPDLAKFHMDRLDEDTVALLSRRAYDVAASTKGVKVFLNGKRIPVKGFKDYVEHFLKGHEDETGNQIKPVYEMCSERWEVAVAVSDNGFQQMSFVNSIATTKGGRHVDHVAKMIENNVADTLKKKNKGGIEIKPHQVRNHLWLFVNCLIVNPTFDSQTKENMTLQVKQFGSSCKLSEKFIQQISKCGIVESVLAWSKFKQDQQLKSKQTGKKTNKLKGIAKLEDANDAGTKNSHDCTLILTEGDSAKTLAVAGLGVVGRDKFGVYPLRGKLLNVREATHKQIMENKEINELVKIVGLQYKKKYQCIDDLKTLRYGRVMIMTDQDQDGSHIKGLLINFIHHNWPELLKLPFLEEFITPIVKATKGTTSLSFYSLPEFAEWKSNTENWHTYRVKYYKGLGTSTSKEAKEYFTDMQRHRILFRHQSDQDDHAITMAFSKKAIDQRKDWLTNWMEEGKRRKELGLPEVYLYEKNTKAVTYQDFINKELVLFSNLDNERSIPSVVDGFKPGQRKVMFTCLKRNDKREVKVAQLAGSVGEMSAYHHGEQSLMGTIINLAQNYVGSNNINLLLPIGQFGTRLAGGKDAASPRYIFTMMSPLTRLIFNQHDDAILKYLTDDNQKIEPEWYIPIIPMVLVNGADGIGTGWMTKIPNYNPREIVENLLRMLGGDEPQTMTPWFKGFRGTIELLDHQRYVMNGEISEISDTKLEITELPVRTWTQTYKEQVMEILSNGTDKIQAQVQDYKEYHTDTTVRFVVQMAQDKMRQAYDRGLHQFFKLQTTFTTSSMVLFDANGCLRRYDDVTDILREFFDLRLKFYEKRKKYLEGMLEAEALRLSNQARFILEKCDGSLTIENKKKKNMIDELIRRGFDPDPVKKWKANQLKENKDDGTTSEDSDVDSDVEEDAKDSDYDYLLGMAMWSLTAEKKEELLRKKDEKHKELDKLKKTTKENLWKTDLKEFLAKLEEVEDKEKQDAIVGTKKSAAAEKGKAKQKTIKAEVMPSPHGTRIAPKIPEELRKKAAQAIAAKDRKEGKVPSKRMSKETTERDEFDLMIDDRETNKSLSEKIGINKKEVLKKSKPSKKKTKSPWSDSGSAGSGGSGSESDVDMVVEPRERDGIRRAAASKAKAKYADSGSGSDSDELNWKPTEAALNSSNDFDSLLASPNSSPVKPKPEAAKSKPETEKPKPKPAPKPKKEKEIWESDSEDDHVIDKDTDDDEDFALASKKAKAPAKKKLDKAATNFFDDSPAPKKPAPKPKTTAPKPASKKKEAWESDDESGGAKSDSDSDFGFAKKPVTKAKPAPPKHNFGDSDSDVGMSWQPSKALKSANGAKNHDDDDDDSDGIFGKKKPAATKKKPSAEKKPSGEKKRAAPAAGPKQPKEKKPKKEKEDKPKKAPGKPKAATTAKKANPWDSDSAASIGQESGDDFLPIEKKERDGTRRAAAAKSKYVEDSGSDSDIFA